MRWNCSRRKVRRFRRRFFFPWEGEVKKVSLLDCGKEVPFTAGEGGILVKNASLRGRDGADSKSIRTA